MMQQPIWQGRIKPITPRRKTQPYWRSEYDIGRSPDSKNFTICRCWAHAPSFEFPSMGIFLSFVNGNASCFAKLQSTQELRDLSQKLLEWASNLDTITPQLKNQEQIIETQLKAYQDQMTQLKMLQQFQAEPQEIPQEED